MPDGKMVMWRFHKTEQIREVYRFAFNSLEKLTVNFVLSKAYPKKDLTSMSSSLVQEGLENMETLNVTGV